MDGGNLARMQPNSGNQRILGILNGTSSPPSTAGVYREYKAVLWLTICLN